MKSRFNCCGGNFTNQIIILKVVWLQTQELHSQKVPELWISKYILQPSPHQLLSLCSVINTF